MKKILITIPFINLWETYTKPLLENIKNIMMPNTSHQIKVLLFHNGGKEISSEEINQYDFIVGVEQYKENRGLQKVWNAGINQAFSEGYDYSFVVNNDVLFHKDVLNELVTRIEKKDVGLVTCFNIREQVKQPNKLFDLKTEDYRSVNEAENPDFSAFMIIKDCWEKVGEFDEGFYPAYFEDGDYHYRMQLSNIKAITIPTALYYHFGSRTQNEAMNLPMVSMFAFERNREYYFKKWGGLPAGNPVREKFKHPFNNPQLSISYTMNKKTVY